MSSMITDEQRLVGAKRRAYDIPIYDDGRGNLYVYRHSIGIGGIVRAKSWETAYSICEDEFFPEADETVDELVKEYGFRVESKKVILADVTIPESERPPELGKFEKFAVYPDDYTDGGKLPDWSFLRWVTISTPDPDAWTEHPVFCEQYGFRPSGPNARDKVGHGIYVRDLSGECLDRLTPELAKELEIEIEVEDWEE